MSKAQKMENFYSCYLPLRRRILRVALGRKWRGVDYVTLGVILSSGEHARCSHKRPVTNSVIIPHKFLINRMY